MVILQLFDVELYGYTRLCYDNLKQARLSVFYHYYLWTICLWLHYGCCRWWGGLFPNVDLHSGLEKRMKVGSVFEPGVSASQSVRFNHSTTSSRMPLSFCSITATPLHLGLFRHFLSNTAGQSQSSSNSGQYNQDEGVYVGEDCVNQWLSASGVGQ